MSPPWLKFYPSDWRADQAVRICSLGARGLWIEMLCVMHEAEPYGHLAINGQPVTVSSLAALTGSSQDQVDRLLTELESAGVFSRNRTGVIYSRRMTRDAKKAQTARINGRFGGNPTLSKDKENVASVNHKDKPEDKGWLKPQKPERKELDTSSEIPGLTIESHPNLPGLNRPGNGLGNGKHEGNGASVNRHGSMDACWAEFWPCWNIPGSKREPRKARKALEHILKVEKVPIAEICAGARRYMAWARRTRTEVRYLKYPTTWLNGGCWAEELPGDEPARSVGPPYYGMERAQWDGLRPWQREQTAWLHEHPHLRNTTEAETHLRELMRANA